MNFDILISKNKTYLNIHVKEAVTLDLLEKFIIEAAKQANAGGFNKFLFDLRQAPNQTSNFGHYDFVYDRSKKLGFRPGSKHALLVSLEDVNDYRFIETILLNAGYQSKMFADENAAIEWVEQ